MSAINLNLYFSDLELENLRKAKVDTEIEDIKYLEEHPEISVLIEMLYQTTLEEKPSDVYEFILDLVSGMKEIPVQTQNSN